MASDAFEHGIIHGLRVDGNAIYAVLFEHGEFFACNRIRPSRLYGKFFQRVQIQRLMHGVQQAIHLLRRQRSRRAAANINRDDAQSRLLENLTRVDNLSAQGIQICFHQLASLFNGMTDERTIAASGRAKRNANINRNIVVTDFFLQIHGNACRANRQRAPCRRDMICLGHKLRHLCRRIALFHKTAGKFRRTHTGQ